MLMKVSALFPLGWQKIDCRRQLTKFLPAFIWNGNTVEIGKTLINNKGCVRADLYARRENGALEYAVDILKTFFGDTDDELAIETQLSIDEAYLTQGEQEIVNPILYPPKARALADLGKCLAALEAVNDAEWTDQRAADWHAFIDRCLAEVLRTKATAPQKPNYAQF